MPFTTLKKNMTQKDIGGHCSKTESCFGAELLKSPRLVLHDIHIVKINECSRLNIRAQLPQHINCRRIKIRIEIDHEHIVSRQRICGQNLVKPTFEEFDSRVINHRCLPWVLKSPFCQGPPPSGNPSKLSNPCKVVFGCFKALDHQRMLSP